MTHAELLTVEDVFQLSTGLTVAPDFSVPKEGWKPSTHNVRVVKPNGEEFDANANFSLVHFNIPDPLVPLDRRWRVVVSFADLAKNDLP